MRVVEFALVTSCFVVGACSFALDYGGLRVGDRPFDAGDDATIDAGADAADAPVDVAADMAPDVLDGGAPALVKCGNTKCTEGQGCCIGVDGGTSCSVASACSEMFAPCDGAEDCRAGEVCCGWGRVDNSANPLVVQCVTPDVCSNVSGYRFLCDPLAPVCDGGEKCVATETLPGGYKCEP